MSRLNEVGRPQWEIDAIDALEDAREQRAAKRRAMAYALLVQLGPYFGRKPKKGRGQRRNRRNRR